MDKSWVTLAVCPICKKDNGILLLDTRIVRKNGQPQLRETFDHHTIDPRNPCKECQDKYLKDGVLIINPETCSLVVMKTEAFTRIFDKPAPPHHIAFCDEELLRRLQPQE